MEAKLWKQTVLVVDDTPENIDVLSGILRAEYKVKAALNGQRALKIASADPPDLILLDIMMPGMDGYEVCNHLKKDGRLKGIPVIFVSALSETQDIVNAFDAGGVDYVTKPFQPREVQARVKTHLELRRYQLHLEELVLVQVYCRTLATKLSELPRFEWSIDRDYIDNIFRASPLHDIGKVAISDNILLKPGKLMEEEFETMKKHTTLGAQTLEAVRASYPNNAFVNMGIAIARSHHEKWNGNGYPHGLSGEDIPLSARIVAIADVYDALRSERPYKKAFSHERSVEIITSESGSHFDPGITEVFVEIEQEFNEIRETM